MSMSMSMQDNECERKTATSITPCLPSHPLPFPLPSSVLSHALTYLDLCSLLHASSVSHAWHVAATGSGAWATRLDDEESSRCYQPHSSKQIIHPPMAVRRLVTNMRVDMSDMDTAGEDSEEKDAQECSRTIDGVTDVSSSTALLRFIVSTYSSLRHLTIVDYDGRLNDRSLRLLFSLSHRHLRSLTLERGDVTINDDAMQQLINMRDNGATDTDAGTDTHIYAQTDGSTQLERLCLPMLLVGRQSMREVIECMDQRGRDVARSCWPLSSSLTSLTLTIGEPDVLRALALLHQLCSLDLTVDWQQTNGVTGNGMHDVHAEEHRAACQRAWRCVAFEADNQSMLNSASSTRRPSAWSQSLTTLHLTINGLDTAALHAISHLRHLRDLAILDIGDNDDSNETSGYNPPVPQQPCLQLSECSEQGWRLALCALTTHKPLLLSSHSILHLRRLSELEKIELHLQQSWILPLAPFMRHATSSQDDGHIDGDEDDSADLVSASASPLSFWSSFPHLFQCKIRTPLSIAPCLNSLDHVDFDALMRASACVTPCASFSSSLSTPVWPLDLLLYGLGANDSLRSLHLTPALCQPMAVKHFVRRSVTEHISQDDGRIEALSSDSTDVHRSICPVLPLFDLCLSSLPTRINVDELCSHLHPFGRSLRYIHVIYSQLGDDGLMHILRICNELHTLDVRSCTRLTRASLSRIGEFIPGLHSLNLSRLPHADDDTLLSILTLTPHLHSLHLSSTPTTSTRLIPFISSHLRLLCLNVRNASGWLAEDMDAYKRTLTHPIQIITDWEESGEK